MQKNNIVYPHHIPFIGDLICDICSKPGIKKYTIPYSKFRGLVACERVSCRNRVKRSLLKTSIKLDSLVKEFGENINVVRSNGEIESGWKIASYAYQDTKDGPFWVFVTKGDLSKCLTLDKIKELNSF